jgi:hypothetical protein
MKNTTDLQKLRRASSQVSPLRRRLSSRPEAPRGVRFLNGVVSWEPPPNTSNVTHYNVYVDVESNRVAKLPVGQTSTGKLSGQRVFVSSYNDLTDLESRKVVLNQPVWPAQDRTGGVRTHREIQAAIDGLPREGGEVFLAPGEWLIGAPVVIPADKPGVRLVGSGESTIVRRKQGLASGSGVFNVYAENVTIANLHIDGEITTSAGLTYAQVFDGAGISGDPMHPTLSDNTSIWIHGGAKRVLIQDVTIEHTGGYSILVDAQDADVSDVIIRDCHFRNNRPHKFGDTGDLNYGAWTGGILYRNRGVSPSTSKVRNLTVTGCSFYRCMGNCIWGHALGFDVLNEQIDFSNNTGLDLGLDFIMPGNVVGGVVAGNSCRRVGYRTTTDEDSSVPAYYLTVAGGARYAVAYDTTGLCRGVNYIHNSAISVNGGLIDLDGYYEGAIANNLLVAAPDVGDPMYTEDKIAQYGNGVAVPNNTNVTKGINLSSSYQPNGSADIAIEGNVIRNCGTHAIAMGGARRCIVKGNKIFHRANASLVGIWGSPIVIYGLTNAVAQTLLPADNVVTGNLIDWNMGTANPFDEVNFCIIESDALTGALTSPAATIVGPNFVYDNAILGNNFGEFRKSANSTGSVARAVLPTNDPAGTGKSQAIIQREGYATTAATKIYTEEAGVVKQRLQISDANSFMNVSDNGGAGTGGVVTGNRTSAAWGDTVFTSHLVGDGFASLKKEGEPGSTYADADANLLDDSWALLKFGSGGQLLLSTTVDGLGERVWTSIGGGAGTVAGSNTQVQFNDAGVFGASSTFVWNKTTSQLSVTCGAGVAGINVIGGYMQSAQGYVTPNAVYNSFNNISGGADLRSATIRNYVNLVGVASPTITPGDAFSPGVASQIWHDSGSDRTRISEGYGLIVDAPGFGVSAAFAGLTLSNGYVSSYGGYLTALAAYNSFSNVSGGADLRSATVRNYINLVGVASPSATAGDSFTAGVASQIWHDSGADRTRISDGYGLIINAPGAGVSAVFEGLDLRNGHVLSYGGYRTSAPAYNSIDNTVGGANLRSATIRNYINLVAVASPSATSGDSFTAGLASQIWHDSNSDRTRISEGYGLYIDAPGAGVSAAFAGLTVNNGHASSYGGYVTAINSIDSFQNPNGGANVKALEADYIAIPGFASQPTTVSGHSPTLKIWHNSSSSRLEIGVSIYCPGVSCEGNSLGGNLFRHWNGSAYENGATGSFTTVDSKTVTVKGGIITAIV